MSTLVTRAGKGSPLTHNEVDANFTNLNTDKIQSGNTVAALTITALTTPSVQAVNSAGLALKNSAGTTQMSVGAGGGDNMAINVSTNLNGTNAQIDISPTGTGHVHIKPTGVNSVEIAPTYIGEMDNITIGATAAAAGSFTNLSVTGTTSFDGSQGTAGQVLTSAGTGSTPTWQTPSAGSGTVTSVAATVPSFLSVAGSPITTSGTLALTYSGTALPVANGGTGATTSTGSGAVVLATSPTVTNPALGGSTSGTVTLAVPAVAGTNTATFPASTGTVMVSGNMPAFSAYMGSDTSIANATFTKIPANTEEFDTNSYYDSSTNYRFTPLIAGYYQVSGNALIGAPISGVVVVSIYKNGSSFKTGSEVPFTATANYITGIVSALIYLNGSTDYVELYAYQSSGSTQTLFASSAINYFQAVMVRSA
jgi:hypothetical protein